MDTFNDQLMSELLSSNIESAGTSVAFGVRKDNYKKLVAIGNLTSYSMQETLHECPRKFQLMKLEADCEVLQERENNCDFAFGHAVGAGVATYDQTRDLKQAIWAAFLSWNMDLFEEAQRKPNRPNPNKSFWHAVWALKVYETFVAEETDLDDYEVVQAEATLGVDLENGWFYTGHIDEVLRSKSTGHIRIKENKTTSGATVDPAVYANSDQALSYAVVLDSFGATEYAVLYTIYSSTEQRWLQFEFTKSPLAKVEWLQSQAFTASELQQYSDHNYFPKRGSGCVSFGRRCQHFESCDFDSTRTFGKRYSELARIESLQELGEIEKLDYSLTWSEILKRQQEKLNEV